MMIETRGMCKSFGDHVVLDGIDLDVAEGTKFALLGPNGAGKTTTGQILSTLIRVDSGEVRIAGYYLLREPDAALPQQPQEECQQSLPLLGSDARQ